MTQSRKNLKQLNRKFKENVILKQKDYNLTEHLENNNNEADNYDGLWDNYDLKNLPSTKNDRLKKDIEEAITIVDIQDELAITEITEHAQKFMRQNNPDVLSKFSDIETGNFFQHEIISQISSKDTDNVLENKEIYDLTERLRAEDEAQQRNELERLQAEQYAKELKELNLSKAKQTISSKSKHMLTEITYKMKDKYVKKIKKQYKHTDTSHYRPYNNQQAYFIKPKALVSAITFGIIIISGSAFGIVSFIGKGSSAAYNPNNVDLNIIGIQSGLMPEMTDEELYVWNNANINNNTPTVHFNKNLIFENTTAVGCLRLMNPKNSVNPLSVELIVKDGGTDKIVYKSDILQPEQYLANIRLDFSLNKGTYDAYALFKFYDKSGKNEIGSHKENMNITINKS